MITAKYLETMALYNRWQNSNLIAICDQLTAQEIYVERGMFFGSIFKTLNHIQNVDQTIHTLIHTKSLPAFDPKFILYPGYDELKIARAEFDSRLLSESQECS